MKTKLDFEQAVDYLIEAAPRNNNKGKLVKEWFSKEFNCGIGISHITEDKAKGNRVKEQFNSDPIVVFVCDEINVTIDKITDYIKKYYYDKLETVLILTDIKPYKYLHLYEFVKNPFSEWASKEFNISPENLNISEDEIDHNIESESGNSIVSSDMHRKKDEDQTKDKPLQQIFYGAPGTGKSFTIDKETKNESVIRTTFHPDSDYSTFVGSYKPVMDDVEAKVVPVVVNNSATLTNPNASSFTEKKITYKFVRQAFLKAYIEAWKKYTKTSAPLPNNPTKIVTFTTNDSKFFINAVYDGGLRLSKESISTKEWIKYVWERLWKTGVFQYEKSYTQNAFGQAVAKWIFDKVPQCTKDKFEDGWKILMEEIKDGKSVAVKNITQTYHLSEGEKKDEISVWIEDAGKSYKNLEDCYKGIKKGRVTDQAIVELLKGYNSEDFDDAWEQLRESVENNNESLPENNDSNETDEKTIAPQFLVIEEINRGNCAQIFGDIFQLLDRNDEGFSEYPIEADTDLQKELEQAFSELESDINVESKIKKYKSNYDKTLSEDIQEGRILLLPPNLYIWATMNTSDQSLFPMDSAFKRRWEWEYIPICYDETTQDGNVNKAYDFKITIEKREFSWINFLRVVNLLVRDATDSEDKQMGNFFIKHDVEEKEFISKVMYYLWSEVCKDNFGSRQNFFRKEDDKEFSFNDLFEDKNHGILLSFMKRLQNVANEREELKDKKIKIEISKNNLPNDTRETNEEVQEEG